MDQKFQTSFIPKKPLFVDQKTIRQSGGTSVFMLVAIMIFILSLAAAGFTVIYKQVLIKNQENYKISLKRAEDKFDISLINKLKNVNRKIDLGTQLLKNHLSVSEVFNIINMLTSEGIRFTSFQFDGPLAGSDPTTQSNEIKLTMRGVGKNFTTIAWQSDVFGQSEKYGKNKILRNPILSDLVLDQGGNVNFTFTATLDPKDVSYEKVITSATKTTSGTNQ